MIRRRQERREVHEKATETPPVTPQQASDLGYRLINMVTEATTPEQYHRGSEPLSGEHMAGFAEAFPQWAVVSSVSHGETSKRFTRDLSDMLPEAKRDRDVGLAFTDPEYFDLSLREIFDQGSRSGDLGQFPHFNITIDEAGPITFGDAMRVARAENYLMQTGFFELPQAADASNVG